MRNNTWTTYSNAARQLPAKLLNGIRRQFGKTVKVKKFAVEIDREDFTGKLTYSTYMVRAKRKNLADLIAVLVKGVWRTFTAELFAEKAFFASLKPSA